MTVIVDYGVGNLCSLLGSLKEIGEDAVISADSATLLSAERIILPGVGAFGDAIASLKEKGLDKILKQAAENGTPLLGICLGMQLLFDKSYEYGEHEGLGLIKGEIVPIKSLLSDERKVPHMGWNSLVFKKTSPLLTDIEEGSYVYYVHSYCGANCTDAVDAVSNYGCEIVGAVSHKNVFGMQFHPEKSGEVGLKMLSSFCKLTKETLF